MNNNKYDSLEARSLQTATAAKAPSEGCACVDVKRGGVEGKYLRN